MFGHALAKDVGGPFWDTARSVLCMCIAYLTTVKIGGE